MCVYTYTHLYICTYVILQGKVAPLLAQTVKNLPAMQETYWRHGFNPCIREIPLEKGMDIHSSILAWRISRTTPKGYSPWGPKESDMAE